MPAGGGGGEEPGQGERTVAGTAFWSFRAGGKAALRMLEGTLGYISGEACEECSKLLVSFPKTSRALTLPQPTTLKKETDRGTLAGPKSGLRFPISPVQFLVFSRLTPGRARNRLGEASQQLTRREEAVWLQPLGHREARAVANGEQHQL